MSHDLLQAHPAPSQWQHRLEPRVTVRFSEAEFEAVERAARVAGVATGALVRECALRWCAFLAAELRAGEVSGDPIRLRRRTAALRGGR